MGKTRDLALAKAFTEIDEVFGLSASRIWQLSDRSIIPGVHHKTHYDYRPGADRFKLYVKIYTSQLRLDVHQQRPWLSDKARAQERRKHDALDRLVAAYHRSKAGTPISEQIRHIDTVGKCRIFLSSFRRTRLNMMRFDDAIENIDDMDVLARFFDVLRMLHNQCWDDYFSGVEIAPVIFGRLGALPLHQETGYRQVIEKLERLLPDCRPDHVYALEPLCMSAIERNRPGSYVSHVIRLLEDPLYRRADHASRHLYYGDVMATIDNIRRHTRNRSIEQHCHDVATVVQLAEGDFLDPDVKLNLARKMEVSLKEIGVSQELRGRFTDRMFLTA